MFPLGGEGERVGKYEFLDGVTEHIRGCLHFLSMGKCR